MSAVTVNILAAIKIGSPNIRFRASVTAKHPIAMLDIVLSRSFVLTAMITNTFRTVVTGEAIIAVTITNTRTA